MKEKQFARAFLTIFVCTAPCPALYAQFGGMDTKVVTVEQWRFDTNADEIRVAIDKALDTVVDLEFKDTTLEQLAKRINAEFKIPAILDLPRLKSAGISPEDNFTKSISGVTLRTALDLIYQEMGLSYTIRGEAYVITSRAASDQQLTHRAYDVTDLMTGKSLDTTVVQIRYPADIAQRIDALIKSIQSTVQPESWDELGGLGTMIHVKGRNRRHFIVVSQTEPCHYEVKRMLKNLDAKMDQSPAIVGDESEVSTRVYPVADSAVTAEQAQELLQLTLEGADWSKPHFINVVGNTLAIKQTAKVHAQINEILAALVENPGN